MVVRVPSRQQRVVLAKLALCANRVVSRDSLIDAIWGERPPATAEQALQVRVSQLRKLIEPRAIRVTRQVSPEGLDGTPEVAEASQILADRLRARAAAIEDIRPGNAPGWREFWHVWHATSKPWPPLGLEA